MGVSFQSSVSRTAILFRRDPTDKSVGYFQSSAARAGVRRRGVKVETGDSVKSKKKARRFVVTRWASSPALPSSPIKI